MLAETERKIFDLKFWQFNKHTVYRMPHFLAGRLNIVQQTKEEPLDPWNPESKF